MDSNYGGPGLAGLYGGAGWDVPTDGHDQAANLSLADGRVEH